MDGDVARRSVLIAGIGLALGGAAPSPLSVTGAGSTFVEPVLTKWREDYAASHQGDGVAIGYQSIGSGAGIDLIKARKVDFGVSDKPLTPEELAKSQLAQFPVVIGGVVPVVNLPTIAPGQLQLTGPLLAEIYLGKITRWNDPAIAQANRDRKLPNAAILTVHRSDGSGTTFNFVNYLSKASAEWKSKVGEGTLVQWPVGDGANGNAGVAAKVASTPYTIGYVEFAFVARHGLAWANVLNRAGRYVEPSVYSFRIAAESANVRPEHDFYALLTDTPGTDAYPIAATSFVLIPKQQFDPTKMRAIIRFFKWALEDGRESATHLGYVPLPHPLVAAVETYWAQHYGP